MSEQILGLWAVYLTEYPDEGSELVEAANGAEAIRLACKIDMSPTSTEFGFGAWGGESEDDLTAEAMTPEAMATRIANEEADLAGTIGGQWLANVACGQAMEIERLRAEVQWFREYVEDAAKLECLCDPKVVCGCSVAVRDSARETLEGRTP